MNLPDRAEHFVTLFDSNFMLSGLALHESLMMHCPEARLWIVAADDLSLVQLRRLDLPGTRIVPLAEIETAELLRVKRNRSRGEYCWTVTPFLPDVVFERQATADRVTYLDADLYFFDRPGILLRELDESGKSVLITEHAYAPEYDLSAKSGRFCVQFLTFRQDCPGRRIARWWQEKCLDWCYARYEPGRYGDQKYLDCWPELFGKDVHVVRQVERTLAPWNVDKFSRASRAAPVFYHFQGFRILRPDKVKLYHGYSIADRNRWLYDRYVVAIARAARRLGDLGYGIPTMPEHAQSMKAGKYLLMRMLRRLEFADLSAELSLSGQSVVTRPPGGGC